MFSIVELKTATLDYGIPGVSPARMLLIFVMMLSISMIPYLFLYLSLLDKRRGQSTSLRSSRIPEFTTKPLRKMIAWVDAHRHPALLHH